MGTSFRPMSPADYARDCVSDFVHYSDESLSIRRISGDDSSENFNRDTVQRGKNTHMRGCISFTVNGYNFNGEPVTVPVINNALAGDNGAELGSFLGISAEKSSSITQCLLIGIRRADTYDDSFANWELVSIKEVVNAQDIVDIKVGGEYFKFVIDNYNPAEVLAKRLNKDVNDDSNTSFILESDYNNLDEKFKAMYVHMCKGVYSRVGKTAEECNRVALKSTKNSNSIIPYLFALNEMDIKEARAILKGFLVENVSILPYVLREKPVVGAKSDALEILYTHIIYAFQNVNLHYANRITDINGYITSYKALSSAVRSLLYKRDAKNDPNKKPVLERLKGKKGQVRNNNLGRRQDYSGRSVITVDPDLDIHVVRIPERSIPYLYKPYILYCINNMCTMTGESLSQTGDTKLEQLIQQVDKLIRNNVFNPAESHKICEFCQRAGIIRTPGKRYSGKPTTVPVLIGRQPTLHKGSLAAFEVEATSKSSMEISPLVCPGFNADFDGDTMYQSVYITTEALEEARTLLLHSNNLFWAKDGAPLIAPRQEIIYGLNQCTKMIPEEEYGEDRTEFLQKKSKNAGSSADLNEQAYYAIVNNKCSIKDTVTFGSSTTTVGRRAFNYCLRAVLPTLNAKFTSVATYHYTGICTHCGTQMTWQDSETPVCSTCYHKDDIVTYFSNVGRKCCACGKITMLNEVKTPGAVDSYEARMTKVTKAGIENVRQHLQNLYTFKRSILEASLYTGIFNILKLGLSTEGINLHSLNDGRISSAEAEVFESLVTCLESLDFDVATSIKASIQHASTYTELIADCMPVIDRAMDDERDRIVAAANKLTDVVKPDMKASKYFTNSCPKCKCVYGHGYEVTKDTVSFFIRELLLAGNDVFMQAMNDMVKLGFRVAKYYAPTLNVLADINYDKEFEDFHKSISKQKEYYEAGLLEEAEYTKAYAEKFKEFKDKISKGYKSPDGNTAKDVNKLAVKLGDANGFLKMVQSGARGSMDNLVQMYAYKGQIRKDAYSFFNTVIESSLIQQLSPIEHFTAAYGARRGIMDRSLETADIGYMSRQMWHATHSYVVTPDCGTTEGITFNKAMFNDYAFNSNNSADQLGEMRTILSKMLVGRYLVNEDKAVTKEQARKYASDIVDKHRSIVVRSPLTCKDPCCVKCYGFDMSTHKDAVVGTPVGVIAAQAVGETTSQLTMRTFQGGGVAGTGAITSAFDTAKALFMLSDSQGKKSANYSPVAWDTGTVIEDPKTHDVFIVDLTTPKWVVPVNAIVSPNVKEGMSIFAKDAPAEDIISDVTGNTYTQVVDGKKFVYTYIHKTNIQVPEYKQIKAQVKRGDGLFSGVNDYDVNELVIHRGFDKTQLYYVLKLFNLFASYDINLKHFEILVGSMSRYQLIYKPAISKYAKLKTGCFYSRIELIRMGFLDDTNLVFKETFSSISNIPMTSTSAVAGIDFEDISAGLVGDMILKKEEHFDDMIEAITFGMYPKCGKITNPNYIAERMNQKIDGDYL